MCVVVMRGGRHVTNDSKRYFAMGEPTAGTRASASSGENFVERLQRLNHEDARIVEVEEKADP
jgi:hypothetical protein